MKKLLIPKQDIPEWEFGDVEIKKFSFGGKIRLSSFASSMSVKGEKVEQTQGKEIDTYKLTMASIVEGLHSVKHVDNYDYVLRPGSDNNEKFRFVESDDFEWEAGRFLLDKIKDFNKNIKEEEIKKSGQSLKEKTSETQN